MTATDLLSSAVVGAVAGAAASLVNGWLQRKSAKELARINLLGPMREAWIGQLRDKLANFITKCAQLNLTRPTQHNADTFGLLLLQHEIHLILNAADESHQRLYEAMKKMVDVAGKTMPNDPAIGASVQETTALAHHVLAAEWKRAQAGG